MVVLSSPAVPTLRCNKQNTPMRVSVDTQDGRDIKIKISHWIALIPYSKSTLTTLVQR
jgi:hypothetical protein